MVFKWFLNGFKWFLNGFLMVPFKKQIFKWFFNGRTFFKWFFNGFLMVFKWSVLWITHRGVTYYHRRQKKVAISEKWIYTQKRRTGRNVWRGRCAAIVYMKSTQMCRFFCGKPIIFKIKVEASFKLYILSIQAQQKIV